MNDEHGDFSLTFINDVLVFNLKGYWNLPVVERLQEEAGQLLSNLNKKKWAVLDLALEWELGTPETDEQVKYMEIMAQPLGLTHVAFVYKTDVQAFQWESNVIAHPEIERIKTRDLAEAVDFLNHAGYEITLDDIAKLKL